MLDKAFRTTYDVVYVEFYELSQIVQQNIHLSLHVRHRISITHNED